MQKTVTFMKKQPVLVISGVLALISCFFVLPDKEYLGYFDLNTLSMLFCLMAAVAGFKRVGVFEKISDRLLNGRASILKISAILVLICFFSSMLITNDVALLTFVPLTLILFDKEESKGALIYVVVLETVAANLGSMLTPVGNPQNIYLYEYYSMTAGVFFKAILPVGVLSLVLIILLLFAVPNKRLCLSASVGAGKRNGKKALLLTFVSCIILIICLLTVFGVSNHLLMFVVTAAAVLAVSPALLKDIDYLLLLTFVFFFLFSGNISRIDGVSAFLQNVIQGNELLLGFALSQCISNVPCAVMLSGFTDNGTALLQGVNIGGLGTPIASLASLISMKIYMGAKTAQTGRYMRLFFAINLALALVLLLFTVIIS